ncbi:hypothetical protein AX17_004280, partial [Amanita inopinata Kibby_2008]
MDAAGPGPNAQVMANRSAHFLAGKYLLVASTVVLVYDHVLTLEQERLYIRSRKKNIPSYLFLILRYTMPLVTIINLASQQDPYWTGPQCTKWVSFVVFAGLIVSLSIGGEMVMRVYAIYARGRFLFSGPESQRRIAHAGISKMDSSGYYPSIPRGIGSDGSASRYHLERLPNYLLDSSDAFQVKSPEPGVVSVGFPAFFTAPLCFDASIFGLTLARAIYLRMTETDSVALFRLIVRDGTLYFMVIFTVNLVNILLLT